MNKIFNIWGRDFNLQIVFDCYKGETVSKEQNDALRLFVENPQLINDAKDAVIAYCIENNRAEIGSDKIENIFKYVIPQSIYIQRAPDNVHTVGLMCAYKFNPDDGLAVVFKSEKFFKVGTQNIII